jgi:hypothetical protein
MSSLFFEFGSELPSRQLDLLVARSWAQSAPSVFYFHYSIILDTRIGCMVTIDRFRQFVQDHGGGACE